MAEDGTFFNRHNVRQSIRPGGPLYLRLLHIAGTPATIDILKNLVLRMAIIGGGAATLSLATVEAPKNIMVTARYLQESLKGRLENQQQKLRAEGQAQERQLWLAWHRRFIETQEQGLPFNEPPPGGEQTDGS